jgi:hypothetical protein
MIWPASVPTNAMKKDAVPQSRIARRMSATFFLSPVLW